VGRFVCAVHYPQSMRLLTKRLLKGGLDQGFRGDLTGYCVVTVWAN
jgi:hypothetical protein